jgi:hypothetical protein
MVLCATATLAGCQGWSASAPPSANIASGPAILQANLGISTSSQNASGPLGISGAKNEWVNFALELRNFSGGDFASGEVIRLPSLAGANPTAFQILDMPLNTDTAGYVRQTGLPIGANRLPRALLPIPIAQSSIALSSLRDPDHPFDPNAHPSSGQPVLLWIDLRIPKNAISGGYTGACDLLSARGRSPIAHLQINLQVHDFAIPDQPRLSMVGRLDWDRLEQLYPDRFEAITPRLINRVDPVYANLNATLDQLQQLAHENRTELIVPQLQPTVKWPVGEGPRVDWSDYDTEVGPWLAGSTFADKTPLNFWPLPTPDYLDNYDPSSRLQYWAEAAGHFNNMDWLGRSAVVLEKPAANPASGVDAMQLSADAQKLLMAHPKLRVMVPLQEDQLEFAGNDNPNLIDIGQTNRLIAAATGLVFDSPTQILPTDAASPEHWLRTDTPGLVPYAGGGADEHDIRTWAWLAFLKKADLILWSGALPRQDQPDDPADPSDMIWFYPGQWFGVDQPVPSIQLKWLRRSEEDYEYLQLAADRGMSPNAYMLARLLTKQVELQPVQSPDPEYGLLSGTVDQKTWDEAASLLARTVEVGDTSSGKADPPVSSRQVALNLDTIRWQQPKEMPYILPRATEWLWDDSASSGTNRAILRLGLDIYNAGDNRPEDNLLQWLAAGPGWEFQPEPMTIGALRTYWVQRFSMEAKLNLDQITPDSSKPLQFAFTDGYTHAQYAGQAMAPVGVSDRREGGLDIDGSLNDWTNPSIIFDGHLTKMLDRPSVQQGKVHPADKPARIFSGWGDEDFYVAFHLSGVTNAPEVQSNSIEYQMGRAWGDDLCEVLVQPIDDNSNPGTATYLAFKPNGVCVVEQRPNARGGQDSWQHTDASLVRYAARKNGGEWTGEAAIPWSLLIGDTVRRPRLLRFNFIQHTAATGESASWAGPIDSDRDINMAGLLYLRDATMGK